MQIVIDINEHLYKMIKTLGLVVEDGDAVVVSEAIKNGTPLPKGHGRLIDADVLADGSEDNYEFCEVVNATPTVIEADMRESIREKICCNTCKNNDDELSGECYECVKGIFDHYEKENKTEVENGRTND